MIIIKQFSYKNKEFILHITNFEELYNCEIKVLNEKTSNSQIFEFVCCDDNYKLFENKENNLKLKIYRYNG